MSYTLPQVQVFQEVSQAPTAVVANLNPFVYGANYSLRRYSEAAEKALIGIGEYDAAAGNVADYPGRISGSVVDASYVKVYADDAWLQYIDMPKSATNPLVCVSAAERNKLRAMPRVVSSASTQTGGTLAMTVKGYHVGTVDLPEAYYLMPTSKFVVGTAPGAYSYVTSEDLSGTITIPINCITPNVQGPDGLVIDFTAAGTARTQRVVKFLATAVDVSNFTVSLVNTAARVRARIDSQVASSPVKIILLTGAAPGTTCNITDGVMTVTYDDASTISALWTAIDDEITASGSADFVISAKSGDGNGTTVTVSDTANDNEALTRAVIAVPQVNGIYYMVPDCAKVVVYENKWIFKTADDVSRSGELYKDVEIGDKVFWNVIPSTGDLAGIETTGWSTVAGFESDYSRATVGAATAAAANQALYEPGAAGLGLPGTACGIPTAGNNKAAVGTDWGAANITAVALDVAVTNYIGSLSAGILHDTYVVTITTGGLAGTAKATVASTSGTYRRTNVPIEAAGGTYGKIYLGGNAVGVFAAAGASDGIFYLGDSYTLGDDASGTVAGQFTAVKFTAEANMTSGGTYAGTVDDTYRVEVLRGGLFVRTVLATPGITAPAFVGDGLAASLSLWTGGDVDDEYILTCTSAGTVADAKFSLTSQRSDNAANIVFAAADTYVTVGASGLQLKMVTEADPAFVAGQYWVITVRAARPRIRITDSAGVDQESTVTVVKDEIISVGLNGVTITFAANTNYMGLTAGLGGLITGDVFTIGCEASAPGATQTLVLADELPDGVACGIDSSDLYVYEPDLFQVKLSMVKASKAVPAEDEDPGVAAGGYNWTTGATQITLVDGITLQDSSWVDPMGEMPFLPLVHGDLYVEYRSLLLTYADAIYSITDITLVASQLGPSVEDNPLSLAVYSALENTGARTVYFTAIPSDNLAGDSSALNKASLVSNIWAFNPAGVVDSARHDLLEAHIDSMSTETKKRWRAGFVGRELPSVEAILTSATNPSQVDWLATVDGTGNKKVTLTTDGSLVSNLEVGDEVRLNFTTDAWGRVSYVTDYVASVSSNTVFYLENGLDVAVSTANKVEAYHNRSTTEIAAACKAIGENYGNKRIYVCWPGNLGRSGSGPYVNAAYGAASVAGLVASVAPQQGLTNVELNGYEDVPYSYGMFSYDELNTIAEGGTLIIMQDIKAGSVYVRHQISTAYKDGNLNTAELSMVKNLDSISYYFSDLLRPFIGRYNVTPQLVSALRTQIQDGLNYLGSLTGVGMLGPQVILENGLTKIRTLEQHPVLKDRIVAIVDVELPAPLNVIELHIVV